MMKILHIGNYFPRNGDPAGLSYLVPALTRNSEFVHYVVSTRKARGIDDRSLLAADITVRENNSAFTNIAEGINNGKGKLKDARIVHVYSDGFNGCFSRLVDLYLNLAGNIPIVTTFADEDDIIEENTGTIECIVERSIVVVAPSIKIRDSLSKLLKIRAEITVINSSGIGFLGNNHSEAVQRIWDFKAEKYDNMFRGLV